MPYTIVTKDGIRITDIPDEIKPDAPELKERVAAERQKRGMAQAEPQAQAAAVTPVMSDPRMMAGNLLRNYAGSAGKMILDGAPEAAGATIGQMVGAPMAPFTFGASVPVGGAIGGAAGYAAGKVLTGQEPTVGGAVGAAITGAIPGAQLAKMPAKELAKRAVGEAIANVAATSAQTALERGEMPAAEALVASTLGGIAAPYIGKATDTGKTLTKAIKKDIDDAVRQETLKLAAERGYKVLPSHVSTNKVVGALEFLAGPSATVSEYAHKNAAVMLAGIRKDLGLPADTILNMDAIKRVKSESGAVYDEARKLSKRAETAITEHQRNRDYAFSEFKAARDLRGKSKTDALEQAKFYEQKAESYWKLLEREAKKAGKPEIIDQLKAARKRYSKVMIVEDAFNDGSGNVAAEIVKNARDNGGRLLDGELEVIHRMASAFPREMASPEGKSIPTIALNRLATMGAAALGGSLYYAGKMDPLSAGALVSAVATTPSVARKILSSDAIQRDYLQKSFIERLPQELQSMIAEKVALGAGNSDINRKIEEMPR